jgi:uncharacterized membrane protein YfhO
VTCTHYFIYENPDAMPFISLRSHLRQFPTNNSLLRQLNKESYQNLVQNAFVNQNDVEGINIVIEDQGLEIVEDVKLSSDQITFTYSGTDSRIAVISLSFTKDWKAFIDDKRVTVFPVYHTLTGIYLPAGDHHIKLLYAPPYSFKHIEYWLRVNDWID